jgi:hypothetical protein
MRLICHPREGESSVRPSGHLLKTKVLETLAGIAIIPQIGQIVQLGQIAGAAGEPSGRGKPTIHSGAANYRALQGRAESLS